MGTWLTVGWIALAALLAVRIHRDRREAFRAEDQLRVEQRQVAANLEARLTDKELGRWEPVVNSLRAF